MSKFGNEEDNFPFRFATKVSREQKEGARRGIHTEKTLKLSGYPNKLVHGWKITARCTPPVVSILVCVCVGVRHG